MADGYTKIYGTLRAPAKATAEASSVVANGRFKVLKVIKGELVSTVNKTFRSDSEGHIEFYVLRDSTAYLWAEAEGFDRSESRGTAFPIPDVEEIDLDDLVPATSTPTLPAATQVALLSEIAEREAVDADLQEQIDNFSGGGNWGAIDGNLPDQTDLTAALAAKADADDLTTEIADRASGDSSTLSSANSYTDTQVAAEASARASAITSASTQDRARSNHTGTQALSTISDAGTVASKNTGTASGEVPLLGVGGKLPSSILPPIAITDTFVVASQAAMLALTAETGDVAVRTDLNKSFILRGTSPSTLSDWEELRTPTDSVLSVNGQTGAVSLTTADVPDSANKRYVTDAQSAVLGNTSGTNTGDQTSVTGNAGTATALQTPRTRRERRCCASNPLHR